MRLNVPMKDDIYERLKAAAKKEGRSVSDVVRAQVNRWLREVEPVQVEERKNGTG